MKIVSKPSTSDGLQGSIETSVTAYCLKPIRHRGVGEFPPRFERQEFEEASLSPSASFISERLVALGLVTKEGPYFIEATNSRTGANGALELFVLDPKNSNGVDSEYQWLLQAVSAANKKGYEVAFVSGSVPDHKLQVGTLFQGSFPKLEQLPMACGTLEFNESKPDEMKLLLLPVRQLFSSRVDPMTAAFFRWLSTPSESTESKDQVALNKLMGFYNGYRLVADHRLAGLSKKNNPRGEGAISGLDLASEYFRVCNLHNSTNMPGELPRKIEALVKSDIDHTPKEAGKFAIPLVTDWLEEAPDPGVQTVEAVSILDRSSCLFLDPRFFPNINKAHWNEFSQRVVRATSVFKTQQFKAVYGEVGEDREKFSMWLPDNYWRAGIVKVPSDHDCPEEIYLDIKGCGSVEPFIEDPSKDGKLRLDSALREVFADRLIRLSLSHPFLQYYLRRELCPDGELRRPVDTVGAVGLIMIDGIEAEHKRDFPHSTKTSILIRQMHPKRGDITSSESKIIEDIVFAPLGFGSRNGRCLNIQGCRRASDGKIFLVDFGTFEPFSESSRHNLDLAFVGEESWISNPYTFDTMLKVLADDLGARRLNWQQVENYFDSILFRFYQRMLERWGPFDKPAFSTGNTKFVHASEFRLR